MTTTAPAISFDTLWKHDVHRALKHHEQWWAGQGLVLGLTAPKDEPWEPLEEPVEPQSLEQRWFDPAYCAAQAEYVMSKTYCGGDALPRGRGWKAAGDLAPMLGSPVELSPETIWMHPTIDDPDNCPPLRFDASHPYVVRMLALIDAMVRTSRGRFLVAMPDLVENIDILATLRGTETLMIDMIERPEWIVHRVREINEIYFQVFDLFQQRVRDERGGNMFCFDIWGPGRTAKVQCDACAMFGPDMFRQFAVPALTEQCRWLDYSMYHLDGETCLSNLDALLEIEPLKAVEWTPMLLSRGEGGGHPKWYDLYRRILKAGKSVQAIGVKPEELIPLLDAVGPRGMYVMCHVASEDEARRLEEKVAPYYPS